MTTLEVLNNGKLFCRATKEVIELNEIKLCIFRKDCPYAGHCEYRGNYEWIVKYPDEHKEEDGIKINEVGDDLVIATYGTVYGETFEYDRIRLSKGIETDSLIKYLKEANVFKKDRR